MNGLRGVWVALLVLLGVAIVSGMFLPPLAPTQFAAFDNFAGVGFYVWFGFASGLALIVLGLLLGFALKRREDYYDA